MYPTAKRASERRHFRGQAGLKAIEDWKLRWPNPEWMVDHILDMSGIDRSIKGVQDLNRIRIKCQQVAQMGPYFVWKWGDLSEVLTGENTEFRNWEKLSPKVPTEGAALIAGEAGHTEIDVAHIYRAIAKYMNKHQMRSFATPWRPMDVQDGETVCCVYKQYRSGSYWPGLRTAKALARLQSEKCKTAQLGVTILEDLAKQTGLMRKFRDTNHFVQIMLEGEYRVDPAKYLK